MHKLIAIAIVMILAFNVAASEQGGFNEETSVEGTDIISIDYPHQASAGKSFGINVKLTEEAQNNTTTVNWITQICINSGIAILQKLTLWRTVEREFGMEQLSLEMMSLMLIGEST